MPDLYEPAEGSLGSMVINYLRKRPDALELSQQQIADLFPPTKFASVPGCLMTPMTHGLLTRVRNTNGQLVYRRGAKLTAGKPAAGKATAPAPQQAAPTPPPRPPEPAAAPAPVPPAAAPATAWSMPFSPAASKQPAPGPRGPRAGAPVVRLPEIDIDALQVRVDRPVPPPMAPKRQTRYDAIFDKLQQVGASTLLPRAYLGAVKQAAKKYTKRTGRNVMAYALPDDAEHCGVWRLPDPAAQNRSSTSPAATTTRSAT